jgi:hypothetical protein
MDSEENKSGICKTTVLTLQIAALLPSLLSSRSL